MVDIGYEPAFGARPLKRAILEAVQDPLAEELLSGGYPNGSTVKVDVEGDGFEFVKGLSEPFTSRRRSGRPRGTSWSCCNWR